MVDYLAVLKAAEKFTDGTVPWAEKFKALCAQSIKEQSDAFKLRFALQLSKQGVDPKEMVHRINAIAEMFMEKTKSGNGKSLKYAGVEFGDVLKEFLPENTFSFVERKKEFKDFDLDNNGYIDLVEFLMFLYKAEILAGYKARHGLSELNVPEAEALIKEFVTIPVLVDTKLDENILGLTNLKSSFEADMQALKDEAKTEVKKRQLSNNLKARETSYEEGLKGFWSEDQIGKKKVAILKQQEKHLRALEEELDHEAADALKPKKNLKKP